MKDKDKTKEQLIEELTALRLDLRKQNSTRAEFKKAVKEFLLLQTLVDVITDAQDFESAIEIILNRVCETMGWNYGEAWVPDSEKKFLECCAAHYMSDKKLQRFRMISEERSFSPGEGLPGRVWLTRQPEWIPDASRRSSKFFLRAKDALNVGLKAGYGIPIIANDVVLAVIVFFIEKARKKDERLITLVSGIASELGSCLKRKQTEEALRVSEEKWRSLTENHPDHIMILDRKGVIQFINHTVPDLKKEEVIGTAVYDYVLPEYWQVMERCFKRVIRSKKPDKYYVKYHDSAGKVHDLDSHVGPIMREGKAVALTVRSTNVTELKQMEDELHRSRDELEKKVYDRTKQLLKINEKLESEIGERKRAEEELKAGEKKYRMLFEGNIDAILVGEVKTGKIIDCNKSAEKLIGRKRSELIGSHQRTLHPAGDIEGEFSRTFKQHVSDKKGKVLGSKVITKNGEIKDVEIKANIFELKGEKLIQAAFHDVTKRKRAEGALREGEERFRSLYDNNPSMYFTLDTDGKVLSVNKFGAKRLGYQVEELTGQSVLKVFHKADREAVQEKLANSLKYPKEMNNWEFRKVCKDKTVIWVKETVRVIKNNKGETNVLVVCEDITERKRAEENLENQLTFLQVLMETIPNPMFYKDTNGRYLGCNKAFEKAIGFTRGDVIGKTVYDLAPKKLADKYFEMDSALFDKPGVQVYDFPVRYSDGNEHNVIFNKATYSHADGKIAGLVGIMVDITDRITAEEALKREKEKLFSILDMIPEMIYLQAPDYTIRFANKQFIENYGNPKDKLCYEVIWDRKEPCENCPTFRVFETKEPEIWISDREKTGRIYHVYDYPFVDSDGSMLVLEVSIDITDQKKIEDDLKQKSNELNGLNRDLRDLSAQLSREDELSRKKFATVLHEQVGQNLAALKIKCIDILNEYASIRPKMKETISSMITTLDDTIGSTRELTSDLYPVVLDALGFVAAVSWYSDLLLKPKKIKVLFNIDEFAESLSSEYKLSLFRIVQEAFQNIVKHTSATEVEIELIKTDGSVRLSIKDNGSGFDLEKVRTKESKGIGIMLMKERALSLVGHIEVKSDLKNGTNVIVEIPL